MSERESRVTMQLVYEAVVEIYNDTLRPTNRHAVSNLTGLKLETVDVHLKSLVAQGRIARELRGQYVPMTLFPESREITITPLPGGVVKIEVGHDAMVLDQAEMRVLVWMQTGDQDADGLPDTDRAMSKTVQPNGAVTLYVGDAVLELTPQEDRGLANLLAGAHQKAVNAVALRDHAVEIMGLDRRLSLLESLKPRRRSVMRSACEVRDTLAV